MTYKTDIRPLILITNDDSVDAQGLYRMIDAALPHGDVIAVAPQHPQSGMSSAFTIDRPLRIREYDDYMGARIFGVNGTPVDCVKLALDAIVPRKPDFLFSGINHGSNSGNSIHYSGTMGAVNEGCTAGITSAGFSLCDHSPRADFGLSMPLVRSLVDRIVVEGLPEGISLNINLPAKVVPAGIRVCRAASGHWGAEYVRYSDPQGRPFYMLTGYFVNEEPDATDTDVYWLGKNYISVVPVDLDRTAHHLIDGFRQYEN